MNRLSMAKIHSIETLHRSGHSNREIARLLGIDRGTVNAQVQRLKAMTAHNRPEAANPHTGSDEEAGGIQNPPNPHTGSMADESQTPERPEALEADTSGRDSGPRSLCHAYREPIAQLLELGLSVQRIHQDLAAEHGFPGSYYSVRRYVQRLEAKSPLPFRRLEAEPGEEAQIDFGTAAPVVDPSGRKRRPWMLRVVLSCSRKGYSEVVWRQTTDNFITALENAFHYFGGVPRRLVIDYVPRHIIIVMCPAPLCGQRVGERSGHQGFTGGLRHIMVTVNRASLEVPGRPARLVLGGRSLFCRRTRRPPRQILWNAG